MSLTGSEPSRAAVSTSTEAKPHRWALSLWARALRRLSRPWAIRRHVKRLCSPLVIHGREHLDGIGGPCLIVPNHTSHFDTIIVLSVLPGQLYERTAVAAAADRFYRRRVQGLWFSLRYNTFPITRGGGRGALEYSTRLLREGWSLLIFPEGTRSRTGELQRFHPGPALLALSRQVPVLPIYIEGAADILKPGTRKAQAAPVQVRIGQPLTFEQGTDVMEANARIEAAVRALAGLRERRAEPAQAPAR